MKEIQRRAAEQLTLPEDVLPSDELPLFKRYLKNEENLLKKLHREGGLGREVCRARAALMDALILNLFEAAARIAVKGTDGNQPAMAVVALGGYGRAELNPHSDIDIQFLCEDRLLSGSKPDVYLQSVIDTVLYMLWDLGLKIGHSVRRVRDCVDEANKDMQSKTALIEARLVVGDEALFSKMEKEIHAQCVKPSVEKYISMRIEDQAARRGKFGGAATLQEPNIKNGCGGLRDYQNLRWMMHFKCGLHFVEDLETEKQISKADAEKLEAAYSFLLRSRNELHYQLGRPVDALTKAVQPKVAWRLGYTNRSPAKRLEAFMGDYYRHARNIDLIVRSIEMRLAIIPRPRWQQAIGRWVKGGREQVIDGFQIIDGEINYVRRGVFKDHPRKLMRVFLLMQRHSVRLHPNLAQLIRDNAWMMDRKLRTDSDVHETFLEIINQPGAVGHVLRRMHELDILGRYLPEFGRLTCLVQHEFFHQYTVDEHTLVCIEKLDGLWDGKWDAYEKYREVFEEIARPSVLYLALLLHDAGKGFESDHHERESERVADHIADRLELDEAATESLLLVIRHHLLMVQVAQRRDLEDPLVVKQFAETLETEENLNLLMLHTLADSLGTADNLWNGFKETTQWTLYWKSHAFFRRDSEAVRAEERQRDEIESEAIKVLGGKVPPEEVEAHFNNLPARYFRALPADEIAGDIELVHEFFEQQILYDDRMLKPAIVWEKDLNRGCSSVGVCTWDRPGLFSRVTGVFAECGFNILSAQIFTREDSIIIDRFLLTDARTGGLPDSGLRKIFSERLEEALKSETDLDLDFAELPESAVKYTSLSGERIATRIFFDNRASDEFTVLDLEAEDHIGLLYAVTHTLNTLGLSIELARINTAKGGVSDSFYLVDEKGLKIEDKPRQQFVESMIRQVIEALHEA